MLPSPRLGGKLLFGKQPLDEGVRRMGAELKGGVPTSVRITLCDHPALCVWLTLPFWPVPSVLQPTSFSTPFSMFPPVDLL